MIPGYVPDSQLRWLYAHAEAFVLPSLLEGFGMPALEAAYMGLLPIVSEESALVEAVGGLCVQVPPADPEAITRAMASSLSRSSKERESTGSMLRELALRATKQQFLLKWKNLLLGEKTRHRRFTPPILALAQANHCSTPLKVVCSTSRFSNLLRTCAAPSAAPAYPPYGGHEPPAGSPKEGLRKAPSPIGAIPCQTRWR